MQDQLQFQLWNMLLITDIIGMLFNTIDQSSDLFPDTIFIHDFILKQNAFLTKFVVQ